jgi:hypothetical protein
MKQIVNGYVIALLSVIMVCLLAVPALTDYTGDHSLTVYEHNTINGGVVFDTVVDGSKYTLLYSPPQNMTKPVLSQGLTVAIPAGATVRTARLYNYYTWSDSGNNIVPGDPAEAVLTLSDGVNNWTTEVNNSVSNPDVAHYVDRKGQGYTSKKYDFPSGTLAWDVTDYVAGSGTFTATIENAKDQTNSTTNWTLPDPGEYFCTYGFGLLVVYELNDGSKIEYWIAEGCDMLYASSYYGITPEMATTSATFSNGVTCAASAELTTVLTASNKGTETPPKNMVIFNDVEVGPSTATSTYAIGVNTFAVVDLLSGQNIVEMQDRKDYETARSAFLVINKDKRDMVVKIDSDLLALRADVQNLDHAGVRTSLLNKIDNAIAKNDLALGCIDAGDETCANNNLNTCKSTMNAFISEVDAQSDIHIPVYTADALISDASDIITDIDCAINTPI